MSKKLPTTTISQTQNLFIKSFLKQGYSYGISKEFVLQNELPSSALKSFPFWPSVGDIAIVQQAPNDVRILRYGIDTTTFLNSKANFQEAEEYARTLLSKNTLSLVKATPQGYKVLFQGRYRAPNAPVSPKVFNSVLSSVFNPSAEKKNATFAFGDIVLSSSERGFEVARLDEKLGERVHSVHDNYQNALNQAFAIVGENAIWLKSSTGTKLVSAATRPNRYTSPASVKQEPSDSLLVRIRDQYYDHKLDRTNARYKIMTAYMDGGFLSYEAAKEADRILDWWDKRKHAIEDTIQVDTGMYGAANELANYQYLEKGVDYVDPEMRKRVTKEMKQSATPDGEVREVSLFYINSKAPGQPDSLCSMETVSLPEISESPMILFMMPNTNIPNLMKECRPEDDKEDDKCLGSPQFIFGSDDDAACDAVLLTAWKEMPQDAEIQSRKIRFNTSCNSPLSKVLTSATNFKISTAEAAKAAESANA